MRCILVAETEQYLDELDAGPLFTKRTDVLQYELMKSGSRDIRV